MPIYAYRCQECREVMEVFHRSKIVPPETCEKCGAEKPKRILSTVAAHVSGDKAPCGIPSAQCGMETGHCGPAG